jgi:hypothetical protein
MPHQVLYVTAQIKGCIIFLEVGVGIGRAAIHNLSHKHYFIDGSGMVHQNTGLTPGRR